MKSLSRKRRSTRSRRNNTTYHLKNPAYLFRNDNPNIRIISDTDDSNSNSKVML